MNTHGNLFKTCYVPDNILVIWGLVTIIVMTSSCRNSPAKDPDLKLRQEAERISRTSLILDSHIDWPDFVLADPEDISMQTSLGDFDLVRARKGGLDAVLSVAYISPDLDTGTGRLMVDSMLKIIRHYPDTYPEKFAVSNTPAEVRGNFAKHLFSLVPCLENGSPVGDDLQYLQ